MIRYILRETILAHVVCAGGNPEVNLKTIDGDVVAVENYLRYKDQPNSKQPDYFVRELLGVELIEG